MGTSHPSRGTSAPGAGRVNTAGLGARELGVLLDQLDRADPPAKHSRVYARVPFRHPSIALTLAHPGSTGTVSIVVASRNLSRGGMSVLHGGYVHPRSRCTLALPLVRGGTTRVTAVVSHCRHVQGMVHELGIRFDDPVLLRDFVAPRILAEVFSFERVDPGNLTGSVLHVESSALGQKLVAAYLKDTPVRLRVAESAAQAAACAGQGSDLVLADFQLPDATAVELLTRLRAQGFTGPIVLLTGDTSDRARRSIGATPFDGYLIKPITRERLLRAVAEFLPVSGCGPAADMPPGPRSAAAPGGTVTTDAVYTTLTAGDPAVPLVDDFAREAPGKAEALRAALAAGNAAACRAICLELGSIAPSCGFDGVARAAARAANTLARTAAPGDAAQEIELLAALCDRVRTRAA